MWYGNACPIQQGGFVCLVVHSPFLDNYTLRVCPSVKFSVTSYYIISRHFKSEIHHREGETQGSGLRLSCPCPTHPEFCGDSLQMCLWGRQEGSMDFGVNAVLGGTMEKLPETVIKKNPKQLLCSYCAHAGKAYSYQHCVQEETFSSWHNFTVNLKRTDWMLTRHWVIYHLWGF